jgi:hypothetical protein
MRQPIETAPKDSQPVLAIFQMKDSPTMKAPAKYGQVVVRWVNGMWLVSATTTGELVSISEDRLLRWQALQELPSDLEGK